MYPLSLTRLSLVLILCSFTALADQNVTIAYNSSSISIVNNNSTSAPVCAVDSSGNVISGQAGCYNTQPSECASSVLQLMNVGNGISSFKFYGSAVYINSLLFQFSPLYNITLDGTTKSVDGFRDSGPLLCTTLFSQDGLDDSTEHEISVLVAGLSPSANQTVQEEGGDSTETLLLNNIVVTTSNTAGNISAAPALSSATGTSSASSTASSSPSQGNGAYTVSPVTFVFLLLWPVYVAASTIF